MCVFVSGDWNNNMTRVALNGSKKPKSPRKSDPTHVPLSRKLKLRPHVDGLAHTQLYRRQLDSERYLVVFEVTAVTETPATVSPYFATGVPRPRPPRIETVKPTTSKRSSSSKPSKSPYFIPGLVPKLPSPLTTTINNKTH